jgi:thiopeptide-type bacteriocin biosynthesis protein
MPEKSYISVYLYTAGFNMDTILIEYVRKLISDLYLKKLVSNYFFIRYVDENGLHIRLRILPLKRLYDDEIIRLVDESYPAHLASQKAHLPAGSPTHIYSPYIPETVRYGGKTTLKICEQYFRYSSDAVLSFIDPDAPDGYDLRFSQSLMLNLVFIYHIQETFEKEILPSLLEDVINSWMHSCLTSVNATIADKDIPVDAPAVMLQFQTLFDTQKEELLHLLNTIWQSCEQNTLSNIPYLKKWGARNLLFINKFRKTTNSFSATSHYLGVLGSLIHMTNNRLGIRNHDESYLAYILLNFIRIFIM